MLPMDEIEISAFRCIGGIGSCSTMFQSIICLGLSITGAFCKYVSCGANNSKNSFGYCFYLMYYNENEARFNFLSPLYFNILMWFNVLLSCINLIISAIALSAFTKWINAVLVKKMANIWASCIILFSIIEVVMCFIFIYDITVITGKYNIKCFKSMEMTFRNAYEPTGKVPYFLETKFHLQNMRKKIRKLNKKLLFLDVVVDENNPDSLKNPFISKTVLDNHVRDVWHEMFNYDIMDKVQRKSDFLPNDDVMKFFIMNKKIDLDEFDINLLKSFDSLINITWFNKSMVNSTMDIERKNNLNPNIDTKYTNSTDKMTNLSYEYLKNSEDLIKADKSLNNISKNHFEKQQNLKKNIEETSQSSDVMSASEKNEEDEILFYLKQFSEGLLSPEQDNEKIEEHNLQSMLSNVKELFETNNNTEKNNQKMRYIEEYLTSNFNDKAEIPLRRNKDDENKKPTHKTTSKPQTTTEGSVSEEVSKSPSNDLVKDLCENCAIFMLWPSIICMVLSIKTVLVWFLNTIVASLVLYYGSQIEVRRKK